MIFVTGANGLIGSFVCRRLLKEGYRIKALKRGTSNLNLVEDIKDEINWVEGDLLNLSELSSCLDGVKQIVHCAALVSYDSRDENILHRTNVDGTANLVNIALEKKIELFLHLSSVASIGKEKHETTSTEETQWFESNSTTAYARSKHQSEMEIWRGYAEGLNAIIINPSLVLGPGDLAKSSTQLFKYIYDEKNFYTGGIVNYVDVRDVAEIVFKLMSSQHFGERYIVNAGSTTYKELFDSIAHAMGKNPPQIKVEGLAIKLAIVFEKIRSRLSGSKPIVSDELEQVSQNKHTYDNSKIKQAVNVNFRSLNDTIVWTSDQLLKRLSSGNTMQLKN